MNFDQPNLWDIDQLTSTLLSHISLKFSFTFTILQIVFTRIVSYIELIILTWSTYTVKPTFLDYTYTIRTLLACQIMANQWFFKHTVDS